MKIKIKKFKQVKSTNDVAIKLIKRNIKFDTDFSFNLSLATQQLSTRIEDK